MNGFTVNQLYLRLGKLIADGHGRRHVARTTVARLFDTPSSAASAGCSRSDRHTQTDLIQWNQACRFSKNRRCTGWIYFRKVTYELTSP